MNPDTPSPETRLLVDFGNFLLESRRTGQSSSAEVTDADLCNFFDARPAEALAESVGVGDELQ